MHICLNIGSFHSISVSGSFHSISVSDDGEVHSFGRGDVGQLGLGHCDSVSLPSPISHLPRIKQVACGSYSSVCIDYEGFVWSFGLNNCGQLGTGNISKECIIPQKIQEIPLVRAVACGSEHTLIITNDSNLWSCGYNAFGQLCLGNKFQTQDKFKQTSFTDIIQISGGGYHSLFQNNEGEIFACGFNSNGELGLGHFDNQITPTRIPDAAANIIQFVCGFKHNLFLDSVGNVFSVGFNYYGQLGVISNNVRQNLLKQIPNIPPIQSISCIGYSSYLIDNRGNVWSFGCNTNGQLGHGDKQIETFLQR